MFADHGPHNMVGGEPFFAITSQGIRTAELLLHTN